MKRVTYFSTHIVLKPHLDDKPHMVTAGEMDHLNDVFRNPTNNSYLRLKKSMKGSPESKQMLYMSESDMV